MLCVVKREACLGLHNVRNTACMMVMIGKGSLEDLHKSTRHESAESHNRCKQDSTTLLAILKN